MAKDFEITAKGAADQSSSSRNDEALKKLIEAWNSKSAKAAKRVGTFGFMAAALAACGGAGSDGGNAEKAIDELTKVVTDEVAALNARILSAEEATAELVQDLLAFAGVLKTLTDLVEDESAAAAEALDAAKVVLQGAIETLCVDAARYARTF
jgi:hypothetical protein